jgi:hypothetical protein
MFALIVRKPWSKCRSVAGVIFVCVGKLEINDARNIYVARNVKGEWEKEWEERGEGEGRGW